MSKILKIFVTIQLISIVWLLISFFYDKLPLHSTFIFGEILNFSLMIQIAFLGLVCGQMESIKNYDRFWPLHWIATILMVIKSLLGSHMRYILFQGNKELQNLTWIEVFEKTQGNELFFASIPFWLMYFMARKKTPF